MIAKKGNWWVLFVTVAAVGLVFLDNTVMPVSLPTIQKQLSFSTTGIMWVVNSYLLTLVTLMLISGRLYDILGMRTTYFAGLLLFGAGSVISGLSMASWWLILGRVVQGIGGSLIVPTTTALFMTIFPPGERARAMGINTGISSIFMLLGPLVGGFLTQYLSWRYIFWINIPVVLFGLIMTLWLLPSREKKESFHFLGALPVSLAIIALVVALMQGESWGWDSTIVLTLFALIIPLLALFVYLSRRTRHPIIDFKIFRAPFFKSATLAIICVQLLLTVAVYWAIYFQKALNYSPFHAGLLVLATVAFVIFAAPLGGYLADKLGARVPITIGFSTIILSLLWLAFSSSNHTLTSLLIGLPFFGLGVPLIFSPAFTTALHHVTQEKLGVASGITTFFSQLAATTGIALMGALFFGTYARTESYPLAFTANALLGTVFALVGLLITFFLPRKPH